MPNPLQSLRQLFAGPPRQAGTVVAVSGNLATLELPGGAVIKARGEATIGQAVFEEGGLIIGPAPSLPVINIEV